MAALFSRSSRALPYVTGATILGAGATYYVSRPRIRLESAQNAPTPALSFPSSMPFPKKITVTNVEQGEFDQLDLEVIDLVAYTLQLGSES